MNAPLVILYIEAIKREISEYKKLGCSNAQIEDKIEGRFKRNPVANTSSWHIVYKLVILKQTIEINGKKYRWRHG